MILIWILIKARQYSVMNFWTSLRVFCRTLSKFLISGVADFRIWTSDTKRCCRCTERKSRRFKSWDWISRTSKTCIKHRWELFQCWWGNFWPQSTLICLFFPLLPDQWASYAEVKKLLNIIQLISCSSCVFHTIVQSYGNCQFTGMRLCVA